MLILNLPLSDKAMFCEKVENDLRVLLIARQACSHHGTIKPRVASTFDRISPWLATPPFRNHSKQRVLMFPCERVEEFTLRDQIAPNQRRACLAVPDFKLLHL